MQAHGLFILIGVLLGHVAGVYLALWTSERRDRKQRAKLTPEYLANAYSQQFEKHSRVFKAICTENE